jgi:hypothetical protein
MNVGRRAIWWLTLACALGLGWVFLHHRQQQQQQHRRQPLPRTQSSSPSQSTENAAPADSESDSDAHSPAQRAQALMRATTEALQQHRVWLESVLPYHALIMAEDSPLLATAAGEARATALSTADPTPLPRSTTTSTDVCAAMPLALVCQKLHIVTVTANGEPVEWLQPTTAHPPDSVTARTAAAYAHVTRTIYDHTNPFSPYFLSPNLGAEAHAYLRFIIDNYHQLPAVTVFVHAKPETHNSRIHSYIQALCLDESVCPDIGHTFLNVHSAAQAEVPTYLNREASLHTHGLYETLWPDEMRTWSQTLHHLSPTAQDVFGLSALLPLPALRLTLYCCAQMAVSRAAIRRLPLGKASLSGANAVKTEVVNSSSFVVSVCVAFYRFLLSRMMQQSVAWRSVRAYGALLEHSWHALFSGGWDTPEYVHSEEHRALYCRSFLPNRCPLM